MAKIKKGIDDFVSGFHIKSLANNLQHLIDDYYEGQIVAHTEARPDLGVDWWTAEYLADNIEKIADSLKAECENLRAYANSGERRPLEEWQNAFKSTKKSKIKKDRDIWSKIDVLKAGLGCDRFIDETYRALSTDVANETLDYIAQNWDINLEYNDYEASAKKSKMKKTPLVDINADDIALSINFYSSGMTDVENGTVKFDVQGDFLGGSRYGEEGITTYVEKFSYPISDFVNPNVIREVKGMVADAMIDQINDQWRIKDGNIEFFNDFANINGYEASAKKSKSFNEMIKEQRKQYKNKKVL